MAEHEDDDYTAQTLDSLLENKSEFPDPRLAIGLACLKRTIPAPVYGKLLTDRFSIVIIEVPGGDWVNWVAAGTREFLLGHPLFIRSATRSGKTSGGELGRLTDVIAKKGRVIAIVEAGDLDEDVRRLADHRFTLKLPDRAALREVARRMLVGDDSRIKSGIGVAYGRQRAATGAIAQTKDAAKRSGRWRYGIAARSGYWPPVLRWRGRQCHS